MTPFGLIIRKRLLNKTAEYYVCGWIHVEGRVGSNPTPMTFVIILWRNKTLWQDFQRVVRTRTGAWLRKVTQSTRAGVNPVKVITIMV